MKLLQFTPFFPPHKGGLEVVAENISKYLIKGKHCDVINITSSIGQENFLLKFPNIIHKNKNIGYKINNYEVIMIPSLEIIHNFPCPKFWKSEFRIVIDYIKTQKPDIIQTHTRFFLQTFLGGIIAKRLNKPRIHVEHGSGYVTGLARWKTASARFYDQTLGRLTFNLCTKIVSINQTNLKFIQSFVSPKKCETIYNGIEVPEISIIKNNDTQKTKLVFIGRLIGLKAVNILIDSCKELIDNGLHNFSLNIIGDGEERKKLEQQVEKYKLEDSITFLGSKNHDEIINTILPQTDILINPSLQEGLPTTVLEGLLGGCVVVATDVGGTSEISDHPDLVLVSAGDSHLLAEKILYAINNFKNIRGESKDYIKNKFNREKSAERYFNLYKKINNE